MKKSELLLFLFFALLLLTAGFTWLFGPYGLIGVGSVVLISAFFINYEG